MFAGVRGQLLVLATVSQFKPAAQPVLQPPQCDSLVEMLTQFPPQHRFAGFGPQDAPFGRFGCVQVPLALQTLVVHGFPSSLQARPLWMVSVQVAVPLQLRVTQSLLTQRTVVPEQVPAEQRSLCVQAFPSLQALVLLVSRQVPASHVSVVHGFPSSQWAAVVQPTHAPAEHIPLMVPPPSAHGVPSAAFACVHPEAGSHSSTVHGFPSLQSRG